jgi:hypothetical protein
VVPLRCIPTPSPTASTSSGRGRACRGTCTFTRRSLESPRQRGVACEASDGDRDRSPRPAHLSAPSRELAISSGSEVEQSQSGQWPHNRGLLIPVDALVITRHTVTLNSACVLSRPPNQGTVPRCCCSRWRRSRVAGELRRRFLYRSPTGPPRSLWVRASCRRPVLSTSRPHTAPAALSHAPVGDTEHRSATIASSGRSDLSTRDSCRCVLPRRMGSSLLGRDSW